MTTADPTGKTTEEDIARRFHEAYERLAPSFGYQTRPETRLFDPESPNGKLMMSVCAEIFDAARAEGRVEGEAEIGELQRILNHMTAQRDRYFLEVKEERTRREEAEKELKELVDIVSGFHEAAKITRFEYEINDLWTTYYEKIDSELSAYRAKRKGEKDHA